MTFGKIEQALRPSGNARGIDIHANDRQFLAEHIRRLTEAVAALQASARVTALGIDYSAYLRFVRLTPNHADKVTGVREYRAPKDYAPTGQDVEFCYQFVVGASLRLSEAHVHLAPPSWTRWRTVEAMWDTVATGTIASEGYL